MMGTMLLLLFLAAGAQGASLPLEKEALLRSELVAGALWGLPLGEAASRLGVSSAPAAPGVTSLWYLSAGLPAAWLAPAKGSVSWEDFESLEAGPGLWLIARKGRLFGYVQRVPIDDWDAYERPAREVFGAPDKLHFFARPKAGSPERARFLHIYRWKGRLTRFFKATWEDDSAQWLERRQGTTLRVETYEKPGAPPPLFMGAFDAKAVAALAPARGRKAPGALPDAPARILR